MHFVIVPGINGSDGDHWQSVWQAEWGSAASRIAPGSWDEPDVDDWCKALDQAVADARSARVVLVAHSLGCIAATEWAARTRPGVSGVFLVAPPDTAGPGFPAEASGFAALTATPLDVPGLLVTSEDDPYCAADAAGRLAKGWRVDRVSAGRAGHISSDSGRWEFGRALLTAFTAGL